MRGPVRRLAERTLVGVGAARLLARSRRGRALVLAYHNVVPDGTPAAGDASLHLPLSVFRSHLDLLQTTVRVISLADLLSGRTDPGRPGVVLTFDDAYRGAVGLALPEVARRGLAATLFVPVGLLGAPAFWWDELGEAGRLDAATRHEALTRLSGDGDRVREAFGLAPSPVPPAMGVATAEELGAAARLPGITLGAHSWTHRNLVTLDRAALGEELEHPLAWLRTRFADRTLACVAYPYGLANDDVAAAAGVAGYRAGLRVDGGWWPSGATSLMSGPRLNVPAGMTRDGLALRLAGILAR